MKVERSSKGPNLPEREKGKRGNTRGLDAPIFHPIGPSRSGLICNDDSTERIWSRVLEAISRAPTSKARKMVENIEKASEAHDAQKADSRMPVKKLVLVHSVRAIYSRQYWKRKQRSCLPVQAGCPSASASHNTRFLIVGSRLVPGPALHRWASNCTVAYIIHRVDW
jgi:hypothetical protein